MKFIQYYNYKLNFCFHDIFKMLITIQCKQNQTNQYFELKKNLNRCFALLHTYKETKDLVDFHAFFSFFKLNPTGQSLNIT